MEAGQRLPSLWVAWWLPAEPAKPHHQLWRPLHAGVLGFLPGSSSLPLCFNLSSLASPKSSGFLGHLHTWPHLVPDQGSRCICSSLPSGSTCVLTHWSPNSHLHIHSASFSASLLLGTCSYAGPPATVSWLGIYVPC